ncbi:hypothetical protein V6N12_045847 [Hibiscus sabdariffa]|uniref:Uncharacterized protein n=1 Tax=Hibiscus sabdariffa TaxID=183260 RepID=A0ABR2G482_9ROSI
MRVEHYLDNFTKREPINEKTWLEISSSRLEPLLEGKFDANITQRNHFGGTTNLFFPLLITNVSMRHKMPKMDLDEALVVKGTMITTAICTQLIGAETKEKGKRKVSTPKLRAAKSMPATSMPTDACNIPLIATIVQVYTAAKL